MASAKTASPRAPSRAHSKTGSHRHAAGVVTKRLARAGDDGYRHRLVPGIKSHADAERLAAALAIAAERLRPPGPHPIVAAESDPEKAARLALLLALAGDDQPSLQSAVLGEGEVVLDAEALRTIEHYEAWVAKAGGAKAAFTGEASWTPQRRFSRLFDRLSLPGLHREPRFQMLTTLGAAGTFEIEADALHVGIVHGSDQTELAAKRILNSGETMLLERRAHELADGVGVPMAALDHGFALWEGNADIAEPPPEPLARIRHALRLDVEADE